MKYKPYILAAGFMILATHNGPRPGLGVAVALLLLCAPIAFAAARLVAEGFLLSIGPRSDFPLRACSGNVAAAARG